MPRRGQCQAFAFVRGPSYPFAREDPPRLDPVSAIVGCCSAPGARCGRSACAARGPAGRGVVRARIPPRRTGARRRRAGTPDPADPSGTGPGRHRDAHPARVTADPDRFRAPHFAGPPPEAGRPDRARRGRPWPVGRLRAALPLPLRRRRRRRTRGGRAGVAARLTPSTRPYDGPLGSGHVARQRAPGPRRRATAGDRGRRAGGSRGRGVGPVGPRAGPAGREDRRPAGGRSCRAVGRRGGRTTAHRNCRAVPQRSHRRTEWGTADPRPLGHGHPADPADQAGTPRALRAPHTSCAPYTARPPADAPSGSSGSSRGRAPGGSGDSRTPGVPRRRPAGSASVRDSARGARGRRGGGCRPGRRRGGRFVPLRPHRRGGLEARARAGSARCAER